MLLNAKPYYYLPFSRSTVQARLYIPEEDLSNVQMFKDSEAPAEGMWLVALQTGTFLFSKNDFEDRFTQV